MSGQTVLASIGAFRGVVSRSFVPLEVNRGASKSVHGFAAALSQVDAGGVGFTEIVANPHVVERTASTIAEGGSGYYKLSLMLAGSGHLEQDGREVTIRPGDLAVYDTSRPYSLSFNDDFKTLIVMFPKASLDLPTQLTEQLTAAPLAEEHTPLVPVVSDYLAHFPSRLSTMSQPIREKLARTGLELIGTLFADVLDSSPQQRDPHERLLQKVYTHIDQNLGSPLLSPGSIADSHFISKRHLHALFNGAGTTVSAWIRERRIERACAELRDPSLADRTIAAIGARCGFSDAAHFSRVFKLAKGVSPGTYREG